MNDGSRDGALVLVSRDLQRSISASDVAQTLQDALDRWTEVEPRLAELAEALESGSAVMTMPFDEANALAPLPRAWQWLDGSAFHSHHGLMSKLFAMEEPSLDRPLMYQGVSNQFYSAREDVVLPPAAEADGIDFEGEFGVIVDEVPMGATADEAAERIRLLVQINDWSLRRLAPIEMKTGFGSIQAKPPCSIAPVAVTPDELGEAWKDFRIALPLRIWWNGAQIGAADGYHMGFGFHELVAHAAGTRALCAGTIIGSGTISNANYHEVGSSCIAERRAIELQELGTPKTEYMRFGDRVRMEARNADGSPLFGAIDQQVVSDRSRA